MGISIKEAIKLLKDKKEKIREAKDYDELNKIIEKLEKILKDK